MPGAAVAAQPHHVVDHASDVDPVDQRRLADGDRGAKAHVDPRREALLRDALVQRKRGERGS